MHATTRRIALRLITLGLVAQLAGCMLQPYDESTVGATTDPVAFAGYVPYGAHSVEILALRPGTQQWDRVATATSASQPTFHVDGPLHTWRADVVLPQAYWAAGSSGHIARVRSQLRKDGAHYDNVSVDAGWYGCWLQHPTRIGFYEHCGVAGSPVARITTEDYQPQRVTGDAFIEHLRER